MGFLLLCLEFIVILLLFYHFYSLVSILHNRYLARRDQASAVPDPPPSLAKSLDDPSSKDS